MNDTIKVIDASHSPEIPIVDGTGNAKVVVWPGMGAKFRSLQIITLNENSQTIELCHQTSDAAYYVTTGRGKIVDLGNGESHDLKEGGMVHIDANDRYQFISCGPEFQIVGGPCPPDAAIYDNLRAR